MIILKNLLLLATLSATLLAGCSSDTVKSESKELIPKRPATVMQYYDLAEDYNALDDVQGETADKELRKKYEVLADKLRALDLQSGDKLAEACDILADPNGDPIDAAGLAKEARELAAEDK